MNNAQIIDRIIANLGRASERDNASLRAGVVRSILRAIASLESETGLPSFLRKELDKTTTIGEPDVGLSRDFILPFEEELPKIKDPDTGQEFALTKVTPEVLRRKQKDAVVGTPEYFTVGTNPQVFAATAKSRPTQPTCDINVEPPPLDALPEPTPPPPPGSASVNEANETLGVFYNTSTVTTNGRTPYVSSPNEGNPFYVPFSGRSITGQSRLVRIIGSDHSSGLSADVPPSWISNNLEFRSGISRNAHVVYSEGAFLVRLFKVTQDYLDLIPSWGDSFDMWIPPTGNMLAEGIVTSSAAYSNELNANLQLIYGRTFDNILTIPGQLNTGTVATPTPAPTAIDAWTDTFILGSLGSWDSNPSNVYYEIYFVPPSGFPPANASPEVDPLAYMHCGINYVADSDDDFFLLDITDP